MKVILHHDVGAKVRHLLSSVDVSVAGIVPVAVADQAALRRELGDADVLLHVLAPVTADLMASAPKLRLVQKIGVGVDAIDLDTAKARGIAVCNMPGTNTQAVVEMTLALLLACQRRIVEVDAATRSGGGWSLDAEVLESATEVGGKCIGLVGYGAVSKRLAPIFDALGAWVVACDPRHGDGSGTFLPLDELLQVADIVSLHIPLTSETRGLLDARRIGLMKHGAVLINTARGPLIDEAALVAALKDGRLRAAGLDVFATEPVDRFSELLSLPNVVVTPHLAWLTDGTWQRSLEIVLENCGRLAAGGPLLHRVA